MRIAAPALLALLLVAHTAAGQPPSAILFDRTVARYTAPEMGGETHPRFVFGRTLAFEARLEVMARGGAEAPEGYSERDVRTALDHHIAEEILAALATKLLADSPPDKRPSAQDLEAVRQKVVAATLESLGGRERVDSAARLERIDRAEVDALLERGAMAAWYLDRALTPLLHPSDDQLRDVYRTAEHPYRGRPFDVVREALDRWFVLERLRVAESGFLQSARSRLRVVVTP
jgi:hypothetical protein